MWAGRPLEDPCRVGARNSSSAYQTVGVPQSYGAVYTPRNYSSAVESYYYRRNLLGVTFQNTLDSPGCIIRQSFEPETSRELLPETAIVVTGRSWSRNVFTNSPSEKSGVWTLVVQS